MILIVDDDSAVRASLALLLKKEGFTTHGVSNPVEALDFLRGNEPELVLLDMNFSLGTSGEEGLGLLQSIRQRQPQTPVILITGWATVNLAVEGMKLGARDFINKPWDNEYLVQSIRTVLDLSQLQEQRVGRKKLDSQYDFGHIIGQDPAYLRVLETVGRVAATDASVLIMGESGTGKELIAEAVHQNSQRRTRPFVKVNLGGISSSLFESELFGHVRGAYTDARSDRTGRFEMANTGTIFLDEIGDLDLSSQVKLLRVLQDRTYEV
ncbi:MAG: sigma-54-dependent Fis family transcriptional regulator, partial [Lewinella sp.]|nr:sigma-54-dependent Fis family transcriptional regulator [Lewinella sp.]